MCRSRLVVGLGGAPYARVCTWAMFYLEVAGGCEFNWMGIAVGLSSRDSRDPLKLENEDV